MAQRLRPLPPLLAGERWGGGSGTKFGSLGGSHADAEQDRHCHRGGFGNGPGRRVAVRARGCGGRGRRHRSGPGRGGGGRDHRRGRPRTRARRRSAPGRFRARHRKAHRQRVRRARFRVEPCRPSRAGRDRGHRHGRLRVGDRFEPADRAGDDRGGDPGDPGARRWRPALHRLDLGAGRLQLQPGLFDGEIRCRRLCARAGEAARPRQHPGQRGVSRADRHADAARLCCSAGPSSRHRATRTKRR
jgi:hypothetical protein